MDPFARKMLFGALAFGSAMLLMAAALSVMYFHLRPPCVDQVLAEASSPTGQWVAAVFERRCGEPAPWLLHVNLRRPADPIRLAYFSGRASEGEVFLVEEDGPRETPALQWTAPDELTIRCAHCGKGVARKLEEHWGAVLIRYEAGKP